MKAKKIMDVLNESIFQTQPSNTKKIIDSLREEVSNLSDELISRLEEYFMKKNSGEEISDELRRNLIDALQRFSRRNRDIRSSYRTEEGIYLAPTDIIKFLGRDIGDEIVSLFIVEEYLKPFWTYEPKTIEELEIGGFPTMMPDPFLKDIELEDYVYEFDNIGKYAYDLQSLRIPKDVYVCWFPSPIPKKDLKGNSSFERDETVALWVNAEHEGYVKEACLVTS